MQEFNKPSMVNKKYGVNSFFNPISELQVFTDSSEKSNGLIGIVEIDKEGNTVHINGKADRLLKKFNFGRNSFSDFLRFWREKKSEREFNRGKAFKSQSSDIFHLIGLDIQKEIKKDSNGNITGYLFLLTEGTDKHSSDKFHFTATEFSRKLKQTNNTSEIIETLLYLLRRNFNFDDLAVKLKKDEAIHTYTLDEDSPKIKREVFNFENLYLPDEDYACICSSILMQKEDLIEDLFNSHGYIWVKDCEKFRTENAEKMMFRKICRINKYGSVAVIPLKFGKKVNGLLIASYKNRYSLDSNVLEFLENLAVNLNATILNSESLRIKDELERFLYQNPIPSIKVSDDGKIVYKNPASRYLLEELNFETKDHIPESWKRHIYRSIKEDTQKDFEVVTDDRSYSIKLVPEAAEGIVNLYAVDITSTQRLRDKLEKYRNQLEGIIQSRTRKLSDMNKRLLKEMQEKEKLEKELFQIKEKEQDLIGKELHEQISQQFSGVAFLSKVLSQKLSETNPDESKNAAKIARLANKSLEKAKFIAKGLSPVDVRGECLVENLQMLIDSWKNMYDVKINLEIVEDFVIDDLRAVNLYNLIQDAISFSIKLSDSKNISIKLIKQPRKYILSIKNDGKIDYTSSNKKDGLILKLLNYRAEMLKGNLKIRSDFKKGTQVVCSFPYSEKNE